MTQYGYVGRKLSFVHKCIVWTPNICTVDMLLKSHAHAVPSVMYVVDAVLAKLLWYISHDAPDIDDEVFTGSVYPIAHT